jgi:hypothetical protein
MLFIFDENRHGEMIMVMTDTSTVEICHQKVSELRRGFFESPDRTKFAGERLPSLIDKLRILVAYEEDGAKLVLGQALHLASILSCHQMDYGTCLHETREVIEYAYELNDVDMQAAALIQQGMLYSYQLVPSLRHSAFCRAMELIKNMPSPLLRLRVLYGYAESMAASGQVEVAGVQRYFEAERHFDMAESLSVSDDDPGRAYFWHDRITHAIHRARFLVAHRQCHEAVELLAQISHWNAKPENVLVLDATPSNVEVLSILAQAYCHMVLRRQGEDAFERACFFIKALVDAAERLGSVLYQSQAQIHYEFLMLSKYHRDASQCLSHVVAF